IRSSLSTTTCNPPTSPRTPPVPASMRPRGSPCKPCRRRTPRCSRDSMDLITLLAVALPMAAAIAVFFWSLDRIRKERTSATDTARPPRATPRELVERLLRPAADNLSLRRTVRGRPTLSEDLARAGLNITPAEYLLIRMGAVALGALIGLFRFGFSIGPIVIAAVGFVIPPLVVSYLQRRRQNMFNEQLGGMLQLLSNSLKTGYAIDRAIEGVRKHHHRPADSARARPVRVRARLFRPYDQHFRRLCPARGGGLFDPRGQPSHPAHDRAAVVSGSCLPLS